MKISEKGLELKKKYQRIRIASFTLYLLAAASFVFLHNFYLLIALVAVELIMEGTLCRCPHCNKMLDCRRKTPEDASCPQCNKFLFKGL